MRLSLFKMWIQERLPLASCKDYGNNLQSVQQHVKKHQVRLMANLWLRLPDRWTFLP